MRAGSSPGARSEADWAVSSKPRSRCWCRAGTQLGFGRRTGRILCRFLWLTIFLMFLKIRSSLSSQPLSDCKPSAGVVGARTAIGFPRRVIVKLSRPAATRPRSSVKSRFASTTLTFVFFITAPSKVILVKLPDLSKLNKRIHH